MTDHLTPLKSTAVTWVLVADSKQAQVYSRERMQRHIPLADNRKHDPHLDKIGFELIPVSGMKWEAESADIYQMGRNATGMVFQSSGTARHMSEPRIDARDEVRLHFALAIAKHLNEAKSAKSFDKIVLVASSKMMSDIKKQLDEQVLKSVISEIPKNLIQFEGSALREHLQEIL